jgi:hypothetical protein
MHALELAGMLVPNWPSIVRRWLAIGASVPLTAPAMGAGVSITYGRIGSILAEGAWLT